MGRLRLVSYCMYHLMLTHRALIFVSISAVSAAFLASRPNMYSLQVEWILGTTSRPSAEGRPLPLRGNPRNHQEVFLETITPLEQSTGSDPSQVREGHRLLTPPRVSRLQVDLHCQGPPTATLVGLRG